MLGKKTNLCSKPMIILFLIICYWFYLNICFGYFLSKIFYNFFDSVHKSNFSKIIKFRKITFNFKNTIKIIIDFFWTLLKNWLIRITQKLLLLGDAIGGLIIAVKIFLKKFKSLLKFNHNFRLLKELLPIFWETFLIFCSLINEICFLNKIINWVIEWKNLIRLLMKESVFTTRIIYGLYLLLLAIFGVLLGFLLGVYRRKDDIEIFFLLLLLKILYNNEFDNVLLKYLHDLSMEPNRGEQFSKFSLKTIEEINSSLLKITLTNPDKTSPIPLLFPIIEDPLVVIETEVFWKKPLNYQVELFKFYQDLNEKVNL